MSTTMHSRQRSQKHPRLYELAPLSKEGVDRGAYFKPELLEELVAGRDYAQVLGDGGLFDSLKKALEDLLAQRQSAAETSRAAVLSGPPQAEIATSVATSRQALSVANNGLMRADGGAESHREGPQGVDSQFKALYTRGFSLNEIENRLATLSGVAPASEALAAMEKQLIGQARSWRGRALEIMYPIVSFESLRAKTRLSDGAICHRTCHFALALHASGAKEVLGIWVEHGSPEQFWRSVLDDLRQRGASDILIFVNGAPSFREAAAAVFPRALVQSCIVELIRGSLDLASSNTRWPLNSALKKIYEAPSEAAARSELETFESGEFGKLYPAVATLWKRRLSEISAFFSLPIEIRSVITTTFAREIMLQNIARMLRLRGELPSDEEALSRLTLVVQDSQKLWKKAQRQWHAARAKFAAVFPDRFFTR